MNERSTSSGLDEKQRQTSETFTFKWGKRETYESDAVKEKAYRWLIERYFGTEEARNRFLEENRSKTILDAGCGSGFSSSILFGQALNGMKYIGVDISSSVRTADQRFQELGLDGTFLQESIVDMKLNQAFDIIFCEGVLHHVSNPLQALKNLVDHLNRNGLIMFYVYKKKAPIREWVDDFVRDKLKPLSNEEAWKELMSLTKLGKSIGDLGIEITVEEDIGLLDIPKGKYDLQRVLYWFFIKMYYDRELTLEEMNHVNFDWYRPLNCHRFQAKEVEGWLEELKLRKMRFVIEESGFTIVAQKASCAVSESEHGEK